jgi:adenosylcobinamide-phosphate synthase
MTHQAESGAGQTQPQPVMAALLPAFSGRKGWRVGLGQHGLLLGPNSGWSEAATAGALQRQIVGPIWLQGVLVTDLWIGDASDLS